MGCCCCLLPDGAKAEKIRRKIEKLREDRKATRSLGKDLEESVDLRSHAPGMQWESLRAGVRVEGRGTRNRGDRREEVEVNPKCSSLGHDVLDIVLEAVEESCAFGEDRVLVGLP